MQLTASVIRTCSEWPKERDTKRMRWLTFILGVVIVWAILLLALGRGLFVIPERAIPELARASGRLALLVGFPLCFLLALGAGQLTSLIPLPARVLHAAAAAALSLPFYSMLVVVDVVKRGARWPRTPKGLIRLLSQLVVLLICGIALLVTLVALASTAGPFMGR